MRCTFTLLSIVAMLLTSISYAPTAGSAQDGRDYLFADTLGLPEIRITARGGFEGFEGVPAEIPAGRYVVTLTNQTESAVHLVFLRLPNGKTAADFHAAIDQQSPLPPPGTIDWIYNSSMAGGVGSYSFGQQVQVIIDLVPGTYAVTFPWPAPPPTMVVTESLGTPKALPLPQTDAVLTMTGSARSGYGFHMTDQLDPGQQVLEIRNDTSQPQHVTFIYSPDPVTREQAPDALSRGGMMSVAFAGTLSTGTTQWLALDFEAGYYIVVGFVTDPASGQSNVQLGLVDVLIVGEDE